MAKPKTFDPSKIKVTSVKRVMRPHLELKKVPYIEITVENTYPKNSGMDATQVGIGHEEYDTHGRRQSRLTFNPIKEGEQPGTLKAGEPCIISIPYGTNIGHKLPTYVSGIDPNGQMFYDERRPKFHLTSIKTRFLAREKWFLGSLALIGGIAATLVGLLAPGSGTKTSPETATPNQPKASVKVKSAPNAASQALKSIKKSGVDHHAQKAPSAQGTTAATSAQHHGSENMVASQNPLNHTPRPPASRAATGLQGHSINSGIADYIVVSPQPFYGGTTLPQGTQLSRLKAFVNPASPQAATGRSVFKIIDQSFCNQNPGCDRLVILPDSGVKSLDAPQSKADDNNFASRPNTYAKTKYTFTGPTV